MNVNMFSARLSSNKYIYLKRKKRFSADHGSEASPNTVCARLGVPTDIFAFDLCYFILFYFFLFYCVVLIAGKDRQCLPCYLQI